jgi:peptidoglycan/xylan/chitin deacetylase (PgdA/CDA1 family)
LDNQLARGVFILSLDTELAWGSAHHPGSERWTEAYRSTRSAISQLLGLLERFDIHATWAVVGHLFLESCAPTGGTKHPDIVRPSYTWFPDDWFAPDPCSNIETSPAWYGRDIIEQILACKAGQEVGCHTFSHIIVGDSGCSLECFASELRACRAGAAKYGLTLRSFVFPRNSIGQLDMLEEAGYTSYRGTSPDWFGRLPGIASRMGHLVDNIIPLAPPVGLPQRESGLWNLPASYFFPPSVGPWKLVPVSARVRKVKLGIREAARHSRVFHLWFHPFNLASNPAALLKGLEAIFAEVNRLRAEGRLDNLTMGETAEILSLQEKPQTLPVFSPSHI